MDVNINSTLLDFIFVAGITLNAVVLLLLWRHQRKELHGRLLISIFLITLLIILFAYSFLHEIRWLMIATWIVMQSAAWYIGPLLLMYIKSLYKPTKGLVRKNILHFLPAILFTIFVSLPSLKSIWSGNYLFKYIAYIMEHGSAIVEIAQILFLGFYCLLSLKELTRSKHLMKRIYANIEELGIQWIHTLLIGLISVCVIDFSTSLYETLFGELAFNSGYLTISALALLIVFLAYNGLTQSKILLPPYLWNNLQTSPTSAPSLVQEGTTDIPKKSVLSEQEIGHIKQKLDEVLDQQKAYKDSALNLGALATSMHVSQRKLSIYLNQHLEMSFFEIINKRRVEEVKRMIDSQQYEHFTLLAIGLEAGFNSRTSFYRTFKKATGRSPSEYKDQQRPK